MNTHFKLGKAPARKNSVKLKFSAYLSKKLPPPPVEGGHLELVHNLAFGMLGNDKYGDCVWAGAAHETMAWNAYAKSGVTFTPKSILSDYSAVTGFNPKDPNTDQGTDMQVAAKYRQDTGVLDCKGKRHKIGAYLALANNTTQIRQAVHLFGAAGIGIKFPDYAMDLFNKGEDWVPQKGGTIEGGHYIPAIVYDHDWVYVVTWGKLIRASWEFITVYMDEGVVYLSEEMLVNGKSLEGFNLATLQADLAAIRS